MDVRKHLRFHRFFYRCLYFLLAVPFTLFAGFRTKVTPPKAKTFLALTNHNCDLDPFYMALGLWRHMRFVASANILQGAVGKLISFLVGPIPRKKGAKADDTVALIEENLKAGVSVGMMPEGNRSWDGVTMFIPRRTAEVAKSSGAALVTYRIHGYYLKSPRWAKHTRRGIAHGELVREYSPEELTQMTVDEIYDAIVRDLHVDAFEDQKAQPKKFKGRDKAESIEAILYFCPSCRRFGTIKSRGDAFSCSCGLSGTVNDYGTFDGDLPYRNTAEWNAFQKAYLHDHADELRQRTDAFFTDEHAVFSLTDAGVKSTVSADAGVTLFADRIVIAYEKSETVVPLLKIIRFGAFRAQKIFFSTNDRYFELDFPHIVSGVKYDALWRTLTGRQYY